MWWNDEVAETVREKKKKYSNWEKRKIDRDVEGLQEEQIKCKMGYFLSKQNEPEGMCKQCLWCFDAVGWVTGRSSDL